MCLTKKTKAKTKTKDIFLNPISEKSQSRGGDFIRTYSGIKFWPIDPRPEEVTVEDIAHALSLKVRWQGHCSFFYTVGAHCLRVALVAQYLAKKKKQNSRLAYAYGLLHDATEAYLPDVPTPVKPYIAEWKAIEGRVERAIFDAFGLRPYSKRMKRLVKEADKILLKIESEELFSGDCLDWPIMESIEVTPDVRKVASKEYLHADCARRMLKPELKRIKDEIHLYSKKQDDRRPRKVYSRKSAK